MITWRATPAGTLERMNRALVHRGPDDQGEHSPTRPALGHAPPVDHRPERRPPADRNEDRTSGSSSTARSTTTASCARTRAARPRFQHPTATPRSSSTPTKSAATLRRRLRRHVRLRASGTRGGASSPGPRPLRPEAALLRAAAGRLRLRLGDQGGPRRGRAHAGDRPALVDHYLSLRFIASPRTLFEGIRKLPRPHPGPRCLRRGAATVVPVLTPGAGDRGEALLAAPLRAQAAETEEANGVAESRERIRDAVESHLISDVPVGRSSPVGWTRASRGADVRRLANRERPFRPSPSASTRRTSTSSPSRGRSPITAAPTPRRDRLPHMVRPLAAHGLPPRRALRPDRRLHVALRCPRGTPRKVVITGDGGDEIFAGSIATPVPLGEPLCRAARRPLRRTLLGPAIHGLRDSAGYKNLTQRLAGCTSSPSTKGAGATPRRPFLPLRRGRQGRAYAPAPERRGTTPGRPW